MAFKSWVSDVPESAQSTSCDISQLLSYLAFDVIADYSFGQPFGFLVDREDKNDLLGVIDRRGGTVNALGSMSAWLRPAMKYCFLDFFWYQGLRAKAELEIYGGNAYEKRRRDSTSRQDLLSFLLNANDPDSDKGLDEAFPYPLRED